MHTISRLALLVFLLLSPAWAFAFDRNEILAAVDEAFKPLSGEHGAPGIAVGVTVGGEHHFFNYGVSSLETGQPVSEDTLFEIGSVSKTFTATIGAYALAQGRLTLEDSPSRHRPELAGSPIDQVALLHLATYTAGGLPLQFPDHVADDEQALSYFAEWQPENAPGETRRYSNPSIGLFGHLAARALNGSFAELLEDKVFGPLGMEATFIKISDSATDNYAWGYDSNNQPVRVNSGAFDDEAYGVKSSAADMISFVDANLHPEELDPTLRQAIQATHVGYFRVGEMVQGLGWEQHPYPSTVDSLVAGNSRTMAMEPNAATELPQADKANGSTLFNKTGSTNGFGAYVAFVPEADVGVVMLANKNLDIPTRISAVHAVLVALTSR